jgi:adenylate cyclase
MGYEPERKFRVISDAWRACNPRMIPITQRVICRDLDGTIVRLRKKGDTFILTVKGKREEDGIGAPEFETVVTEQFAREVFEWKPPKIDKDRWETPWGGRLWEVDVFRGANYPLELAEIEGKSRAEVKALTRADMPPWIGKEVTADPRYTNSYMEDHPFPEWGSSEPAGE